MSSLCWWNESVGPPYLGCSSGNMLVLILLAPSSSLHRSRYICHHGGCRFGGIGEALRGGIPSVFAWRQLLHGGGVLDFPLVVQTDHQPGRDIRYSHTHTHTHLHIVVQSGMKRTAAYDVNGASLFSRVSEPLCGVCHHSYRQFVHLPTSETFDAG